MSKLNFLDTDFMHPSDQIILIINRIYKSGLTTTSGGNISILDENGDIWVTPSAVDKGTLTKKDICCVHPDGRIEGPHKPSSEFPFHKAIYEQGDDIRAVIHAHPPALVSFSIVAQKPNTNVIPQAKEICGPIGFAPYEIPGTKKLGERIAEEFEKGHKAVIMENHGVVVGGSDLKRAFERFETLEFCGRSIINAKILGEPHFLDDKMIEEFEDQIPYNLAENKTTEHPSDERIIRKEIVDIVHRACDQGLMISSYGTVSVRWRDDDFLITPTNFLRWNMQAKDIVQIKGGKKEAGKIPSRAVHLHQEIYKNNPNVNSIILTQPSYIMGFSVSHEKFDVRTIPESWIFLQDVPNLSFGSHFAGKTEIVDKIKQGVSTVIVENDSIIVTGDKLLQTFDRLEVAEFSAKSLIMGSTLGSFHPMGEKEIDDLKVAFNI